MGKPGKRKKVGLVATRAEQTVGPPRMSVALADMSQG